MGRFALQLAYVVAVLAIASAGTLNLAFGLVPDVKLDGVEVVGTFPNFSVARARSESFQHELTAWFDQHWALRGYAVRTENTIGVRVFGETRTDQHAAVGREGVLFTRDDLAYVNRAESPTATVALAKQFGRVQQKLRARGTEMLPILIPSKTTLYRDFVPATWRRRGAFGRSDTDVYAPFVETLRADGTLFVDARALLVAESKRPEDVFSHPGRHWRPAAGCRTLQAAVDALRSRIPELGTAQIDCTTKLDEHPSVALEDFDIFRLINIWGEQPRNVEVDLLTGSAASSELRFPTLYVGSSFVWKFSQVTRELRAFSPAYVYFYDESIVDSDTTLIIKKVVPFTDEWRKDTFGRQVIIVGVLETFLPEDGKKFLDEVEKELDSRR